MKPQSRIEQFSLNIFAVHGTNKLEVAISRKVELIRVFRLFGDQVTFDSVASAIKSIEEFPTDPHMEKFQRFEIYVRFTNGDKVEASFKERKDAVTFLKQFE